MKQFMWKPFIIVWAEEKGSTSIRRTAFLLEDVDVARAQYESFYADKHRGVIRECGFYRTHMLVSQ